jgi:hypothetical protein
MDWRSRAPVHEKGLTKGTKYAACRGEAFGQKIVGDRDKLLPECFALRDWFIHTHTM